MHSLHLHFFVTASQFVCFYNGLENTPIDPLVADIMDHLNVLCLNVKYIFSNHHKLINIMES